MKLTDKSLEQAKIIIKHIESLGGSLIKECSGGSIYYTLDKIECIRISDHISLKYKINKIDIIIKDNQFLCIYHRDIKIFTKIIEVKQWIDDMKFSINLFSMYLEDNVDSEVARLKKESNTRQNKIEQLTKENKELKKIVEENIKSIAKRDRQIEDKTNKLIKASEYHNRCQELESENKKLLNKIESLKIQLIKENE